MHRASVVPRGAHLEIAVCDTLAVAMLHGAHELEEERPRLRLGEPPLRIGVGCHAFEELAARHELHEDVRDGARVVVVVVEKINDVRMSAHRLEHRALEVNRLARELRRVDDLACDRAVTVRTVDGSHDGAERALAEQSFRVHFEALLDDDRHRPLRARARCSCWPAAAPALLGRS